MNLDDFLTDFFKKGDKVFVYATELQELIKEKRKNDAEVRALRQQVSALQGLLEYHKNAKEPPTINLKG